MSAAVTFSVSGRAYEIARAEHESAKGWTLPSEHRVARGVRCEFTVSRDEAEAMAATFEEVAATLVGFGGTERTACLKAIANIREALTEVEAAPRSGLFRPSRR